MTHTTTLENGIDWIHTCHTDEADHLHNSVYFLEAGGENVLIDAGPVSHRDEMIAAIEGAVGDAIVDKVILTKAHIPHAGNVNAITRQWDDVDLQVFVSQFPPENPDFFGLPNATMTGMGEGESIEIGGRRFSLIYPPLGDVAYVMWIFDHESGTLFSADGFGQYHRAGECESPSVSADNADLVDRYYEDMFPWLTYCVPEEILAAVDDLFETYDVEYVAPTHGYPIPAEDIDLYRSQLRDALTGLVDSWSPRMATGD